MTNQDLLNTYGIQHKSFSLGLRCFIIDFEITKDQFMELIDCQDGWEVEVNGDTFIELAADGTSIEGKLPSVSGTVGFDTQLLLDDEDISYEGFKLCTPIERLEIIKAFLFGNLCALSYEG